MTKHDRLMNALKEIKSICEENDNKRTNGCKLACPFIVREENGFRGCEVFNFIDPTDMGNLLVPCFWGEENTNES